MSSSFYYLDNELVNSFQSGPGSKRKFSEFENTNNNYYELSTTQYSTDVQLQNQTHCFDEQLPSPEELELIDQFEASIHASRSTIPNYFDSVPRTDFPNEVTIDLERNNDWFNCGLPQTVQKLYQQRGIKSQYFWQRECLSSANVMAGKNLLISLPTSGGKTLVAEMTILRSVIVRKKKAIMVLPYVSIVVEKVNQFTDLAQALNFQVEGYYGSQGIFPLPSKTDVAVCTLEKAYMLVNQLIEEDRLTKEIGLIVVDEIHMVDDHDRGSILELLLSKVLFLAKDTIQIIGMSATVPNVEELAMWLHADCYRSDFRPVPLVEKIKCGKNIFASNGDVIGELPMITSTMNKENIPMRENAQPRKNVSGASNSEAEDIYLLCHEVTQCNHSVLVFCGTKDDTERTASDLAKLLSSHSPSVQESQKDQKLLLLQKLKFANSGGIDSTLLKTIPFGVAFHHSGLTVDERELIEEAFSTRILNVLVSTSTLAAGVNLPARRVIIKSIHVGYREVLNSRQYKQMCGRAGRAGIDSHGESVLCVAKEMFQQALQLVNNPLSPVQSCLHAERGSKGLKRLVLDAICGQFATCPGDIVNFIHDTLLAQQVSTTSLDQQLHEAINFLIENNMIEFSDQTETIVYKSTQLGMATHRSSFAPDHEALIVNQELQHAMGSLVLSDELHLCYLITPLFNLPAITDWMGYFKLFGNLDSTRSKIAEIIGINESLLYKQAMSGVRNSGNKDLTSKSSALLRSAIRFFYALVLEDLLNETPIFEVQIKFGVNRGTLQSLLQSAQSFAMQSVNFCKTLEYWALSDLLASYCKRLNFGVKPEIVPLTEIKGVKKARARALYNAGFRSVRQISLASPEELARSVNLGQYGEGVARNIIRAARELLEKKAKELREAAEDLLV